MRKLHLLARSDLGFVDEPNGQRGLTPAAVPVWPPATTPPSALVAHTATITHLCAPPASPTTTAPASQRTGEEMKEMGEGHRALASQPLLRQASDWAPATRQRGSGEQARQGRGGGAQKPGLFVHPVFAADAAVVHDE
ncbi:uncharacterized protein LOC125515280 [Triticum urartu]|uniref:uncharacterized protein LOC125515280 n=1 Tax=Triticum urartu TaxID=4572 RepID=UPI0020444D12|nr:uncharacterized protein LOC125515280 [Triticum urartu]